MWIGKNLGENSLDRRGLSEEEWIEEDWLRCIKHRINQIQDDLLGNWK